MSRLPSVPAPLVLAAPSGTGKTTLAQALVDRHEDFTFSVSATTRSPRPGETDGVDYHFVDRAAFERMASVGELVEWAEVHGRLYGTPRAEIERAAAEGRHVVLDIDVQGALLVRERVPSAILVFVLPPSVDALLERLRGRGTEDRPEVAHRLRSALTELARVGDFDFVVVNDDLDRCLAAIRGIVDAEGYRVRRTPSVHTVVEGMTAAIGELLDREHENIPS